jgi:hypothetical protein
MDRKSEIMGRLNTIYQNKPGNKIGKFADFRKTYQYMRIGDIDNALIHGKNILDTDNDTTHIKMTLFDMGNMYLVDKKDKTTGETYYRELIKRFPYDILSTMALIRLGEWKSIENGNLNENITKTEANNKNSKSSIDLGNYPNPFNPSTVISYTLETQGIASVQLKVYDVLGREIKTLVNENQTAGKHEIQFNASDIASGMYFYRLTVEPSDGSKAMVINRSMQIIK